MEQNLKLGMNKTGIDMSPIHSKAMIEGTHTFTQDSGNGFAGLAELESHFIENAGALGSVPMPGTVKGAVKTAGKKMMGLHPEVFINKLGERLAYERSGVRVYEQLLQKCTRKDSPAQQFLPLAQLREFRDQEEEHFHMLVECIATLGADPTAQTPDANASGVAAMGLMKVIMDPRASISQSLEAMLALELTDNAAWELLIKLAEDMGVSSMAAKFEHALKQENNHLACLKQWYEQSVRAQL